MIGPTCNIIGLKRRQINKSNIYTVEISTSMSFHSYLSDYFVLFEDVFGCIHCNADFNRFLSILDRNIR